MSEWKFILINREGMRHTVEEPIDWTDPEIVISRDLDSGWHGVFFDYGVEKLTFTGKGAELIRDEYIAYGVNGDMRLDIQFACADGDKYDDFYKNGRISFEQYESECGEECSVTIGIEDSNDIMLLKNNYEQSVDLNANVAFDQQTLLSNYTYLGFEQVIPGRGLPQRNRSFNKEIESVQLLDFPNWNFNGTTGTERGRTLPVFAVSETSEIDTNTINTGPFYYHNDGTPGLNVPPFVTINNNTPLKCAATVYRVSYRVKGRIIDNSNATRIVDVNLVLNIGIDNNNQLQSNQIQASYETGIFRTTEFDLSFDGYVTLGPGYNLYLHSEIIYQKLSSANIQSLVFQYDPESFFEISGISLCEDSTAKSYMINEAISRVCESITNDNIRFYSETFGRTDSEPYSINYDACEGLFSISNGLNIRQKRLLNGNTPSFFVTIKQLFDGLNAIWNIGLTIEPDPNRPGYNRLRFERWRYFYQDDVSVRFNYASKVSTKVDSSRVFNQLKVGYNKWEAEGTTGLYELMTKREYRVNVNSANNILEKMTDVVCSPYTIEITRRKNATSEDWKYDNDIFGFCLKKDGGEYAVETFLDNVTESANIQDPNTCYNARITPARNAMRHFDFFLQGMRVIYADTKLIFSKGEGNYIAALRTNKCNIENKTIAENEDIDLTDFSDLEQARPITYSETVTFEHTMNYNTFKRIKDDPTVRYKSFAYKCNGVEYEGWLDELRYRPMSGTASVTLIPKNKVSNTLPPQPSCGAAVSGITFTPGGEDGYMIVDWIDNTEGATFWMLYIFKDGQPFLNGITVTAHPVPLTSLEPGTYSVMVMPFCGTETPGINYVEGSFVISPPSYGLVLSATLTTGRNPNKLQLTATGSVQATSGFTFKFGQCTFNNSIGTEACRAYPGAAIQPPNAQPGIVNFTVGDTTKMVESSYQTPGADFGYITKVVIYDLVGITPAQITKANGQTWELVIM